MKKLIITIGICITVILAAGLYIHQQYLFNPISFKKDDVVIHDWSYYQIPLVMEIANIDKGWTTSSISNRKDIEFVYNELRSAEKTVESVDASSLIILLLQLGVLNTKEMGLSINLMVILMEL